MIDWAQHLAELAEVVRPDNLLAKVTRARALRRRGEIEPAQALLEDIYSHKPENFASGAILLRPLEIAHRICKRRIGAKQL